MRGSLVLVTGATGFVGKALVRNLLQGSLDPRGLRLLVRDPERAVALGLPAESLVRGSLEDRASLARAVAGVGVAVHLAGAIRALSRAAFVRVNSEGTAALAAALRQHARGCRLVHVSSLAAAGPSIDGSRSAVPPGDCRPVSRYGESKRGGELAVAGLGDALSWVVLRPPLVYGPGDAATRTLFRHATGPLCPVPWRRRTLSLIHVDDLVAALRLAAESAVTGRFLPLEGPDRLDTDAVPREIGRACGRRVRAVRVPLALTWPAAWAADAWGRIVGRAPTFGTDKLREIRAAGWVCDPGPAREALGFVPRVGAAEGLRRTAEAEGWRRESVARQRPRGRSRA